MSTPPLLQVRLQGSSGPLEIDVDFSLTSAWTVLFGPSGSGKSTILQAICGLRTFAEERVVLQGDDLTRTAAHRRRVGLVAQQPALFPHLDVSGNIAFSCKGRPGCEDRIAEVVRLFDLEPLRRARIATLSGGERQRVALARALAAAPRLLLLDETFNGMHRTQRAELLQRLRGLCAARSLPVLAVTHDVAEAITSAEQVLKLERGRIVAQGVAAEALAEERAALLQQL